MLSDILRIFVIVVCPTQVPRDYLKLRCNLFLPSTFQFIILEKSSHSKLYYSLCNENQLDALFIVNLFRQSTSTCFEHICPSSGGIYTVYVQQLVRVSRFGDWQLAVIKMYNTHQLLYIYSV
jgi:hypothetical protein